MAGVGSVESEKGDNGCEYQYNCGSRRKWRWWRESGRYVLDSSGPVLLIPRELCIEGVRLNGHGGFSAQHGTAQHSTAQSEL